MVCQSNCCYDWSPARMIIDMLRCYSLNTLAWCRETDSQESLCRHNGTWPRWSRVLQCEPLAGEQKRKKGCKTPKHFVWSTRGAGTEAKLSFCGIWGEKQQYMSSIWMAWIAVDLKCKWGRLIPCSTNCCVITPFSHAKATIKIMQLWQMAHIYVNAQCTEILCLLITDTIFYSWKLYHLPRHQPFIRGLHVPHFQRDTQIWNKRFKKKTGLSVNLQ